MRDSLGSGEGGGVPGRRAVLRGLAAGLVAGPTALLGGCDDPPGGSPGSPDGVRVERGSVSGSGFTDAAWVLARPDGDARVPLCVVLHGKGGHVDQVVGGGLRADAVLGDLLARGDAPFAVAAVDGGDGYWHARADGSDSGALVTDHLLPTLADHGIDTDRIGLLGWSMGGYGALLLAGQLGRPRVAGVVAESPALWFGAGETSAGAFDDAEDYAAHPVMGRQADLDGIPVRIDCGESDPFYAASVAYVDGFRGGAVESSFGPGDHTMTYWAKQAPSQLSWMGRRLRARP